MTEPAKKYWSDILDAIREIESFTSDLPGLNAYLKDRRTKWAAERGLAIIGEAVNHLRRLDADGLPSDVDRIVAMRNRLIHSYDNIDDDIVWRVIRGNLPQLKQAAESALKGLIGGS